MPEEEKCELTESEKKMLETVGTVGASNAAIALSELTGTHISMNVASTLLTRVENLPNLVKPPSKEFVLFYSPLIGISSGSLLVMMPTTNTLLLVDMLTKRKLGSTEFLDEMDESMIKETINILGNAYLTALNNFLDITLFLDPAALKTEVISFKRDEDVDALVHGGLVSVAKGGIGEKVHYVLTINAELLADEKFMGTLILVVGFLRGAREMLR